MSKPIEGVLYYNHGTRCLVRLAVSIHSLRKFHPVVPVAVAAEGGLPDWMLKFLDSSGVSVVKAPASDEYGLVKKSRIWRVSPFQRTVFLDADTLVRGRLDDLFKGVARRGVVVTHFNGWTTDKGRMKRRIEQWRGLVPAMVDPALKYGRALNTGIFGWADDRKSVRTMKQYEDLTARGLAAGGIQRKTLDELAMQLVVPGRRHVCAPPDFNTGCVHGDGRKAVVVHYHGHKHCRDGPNGDLWKAEFRDLAAARPELAPHLEDGCGDASVVDWMACAKGRRGDVTVVTAVNPQYAERARRNMEVWMRTPGLMEQKFLVFVNGFKNPKDRAFLNLPNVQVVRWAYDGATPRETMLSAFVLGVAKHVKTDYWMKLDADTAPTKGLWEWPAYRGKDVVSHKWGYTKMKGEPTPPQEHWFTRMDRLFAGSRPLFKELDPVRDFRVSHRKGNPHGVPMRYASFCHIERSALTRRMVAAMEERCGGRMPIPSHDTLSWYFATLWKAKVQLVDMKEWFNP